MLSVASQTAPEDWLLALYLTSDNADTTRNNSYYRRLLTAINRAVHDTPRVIANRTVQISRQLTEMGISVDMDLILTDFARHLQNADRHFVYGDLCAQYVILRQQHLTHALAMQTLFELLEK